MTDKFGINPNSKRMRKTSKHRGVHWNKELEKWQGQIVINGRNRYLGLFEGTADGELKAAEAFKAVEAAEGVQPRPTSSVHRGVTWSKKAQTWHAQIYCPHKHLGEFANEEDAAAAYKEAFEKRQAAAACAAKTAAARNAAAKLSRAAGKGSQGKESHKAKAEGSSM